MSMRNRHPVITVVDIGTTAVRVVVAEDRGDTPLPYVVAAASVPNAGMRRGGIVDPSEVAGALGEALRQAEMQCGANLRSAVFSLGGTDITTRLSRGVVVVGRSDGQIAQDDVDRALTAAQAVSIPPNKEIIHILPRRYSVDDQADIKDPVGMTGIRLETEAMIIDAPVSNLHNIENAAAAAQLSVEDIVVGALAAADAVLDRQQKELGVVAVCIGAATTSLVVYEEGELVHAAILPVGGGHVTNDIAIGLRTAVDTAEAVKLHYGVAIADSVDRREECDLAAIDPREEGTVSRYHVAEIIQARMEEIFGLVQAELVRIGKAQLLPAGAVLTGGGAKLPYTVRLAKDILRLPVRIGEPLRMPGMFDRVDDQAFVTALGLIRWAMAHERQGTTSTGAGMRRVLSPLGRIKDWITAMTDKVLPS